MKIGNVQLKNDLILAPMANYTDAGMRYLASVYGVGLTVTEMVSAKGLCFNNPNTTALLETRERGNCPVAVQLFGADPEYIKKAVEHPLLKDFDIIDINMGCPAPKVTKNGEGSKLMLEPDKVEKITRAVVQSSTVPVTVKIRKGWDNDNINAVEVAKRIEQAGAMAITVHGRTRSEFYSGTSDLDIIKQVKKNVKIPVIGNGDVKNAKDAIRMFKETNCDGIMISRGSLGSPWVFEQIQEELENKVKREISKEEKLETIIKHIELETEEKGDLTGVREMRKHLAFYIKGEKNASEVREKINHIDDKKELEKTIIEYFKNI